MAKDTATTTQNIRRPPRLKWMAAILFVFPLLINGVLRQKRIVTSYFSFTTEQQQQRQQQTITKNNKDEGKQEQPSSSLLRNTTTTTKTNMLQREDPQRQQSELENEEVAAAAAAERKLPPIKGEGVGKSDENPTTTGAAADGSPPPLAAATTTVDNNNMEDYSSVDYAACCGLGHRLARMSNAYYVARHVLGFELRSHWGFCQAEAAAAAPPVSIYASLFDPYPRDELEAYVNSTHQRVFFGNEVAGFVKLDATAKHCIVDGDDKIASDLEFYSSLRNRFKRRRDVEAFVKQHEFETKLVLGIHVRAGNGETGDFERKNRQVADAEHWVHNVTSHIRTLVVNSKEEQAVLFMATDTPSYIDRFRTALSDVMLVVVWEQNRVPEGQGVFFGESGAHKKTSDTNECLRRWEDTLMDQILLSHADVVIAGKESSFSQTMPLSIAFGCTERKIDTPYCEARGVHGQQLECFSSYEQWACHDTNYDITGTPPMKVPMFPKRPFPTPVSAPRQENKKENDGLFH